jgi:hypothetical protein
MPELADLGFSEGRNLVIDQWVGDETARRAQAGRDPRSLALKRFSPLARRRARCRSSSSVSSAFRRQRHMSSPDARIL